MPQGVQTATPPTSAISNHAEFARPSATYPKSKHQKLQNRRLIAVSHQGGFEPGRSSGTRPNARAHVLGALTQSGAPPRAEPARRAGLSALNCLGVQEPRSHEPTLFERCLLPSRSCLCDQEDSSSVLSGVSSLVAP